MGNDALLQVKSIRTANLQLSSQDEAKGKGVVAAESSSSPSIHHPSVQKVDISVDPPGRRRRRRSPDARRGNAPAPPPTTTTTDPPQPRPRGPLYRIVKNGKCLNSNMEMHKCSDGIDLRQAWERDEHERVRAHITQQFLTCTHFTHDRIKMGIQKGELGSICFLHEGSTASEHGAVATWAQDTIGHRTLAI